LAESRSEPTPVTITAGAEGSGQPTLKRSVAAKPFLIFLVVMVFVYPTVTKNALEIYNCVDYEGTRGASV
jgi:hypothetical protein